MKLTRSIKNGARTSGGRVGVVLLVFVVLWSVVFASCAQPLRNEPGVNSSPQVIEHPVEPVCRKIELGPAKVSFHNGFDAFPVYYEVEQPHGKSDCTFTDGSRASVYDQPPLNHHDVYIELGGNGVFHKFEVRFKKPITDLLQANRYMPGRWRIPLGTGADLVVRARYNAIMLSFVPSDGACAFAENLSFLSHRKLLEHARIIYGGYKRGTQDYYYWDFAGLNGFA